MRNSKVSLNVLSNIILQIVTLICGLIIPKLILNTFGSEVNGLISSLNQFLNYITLLEGGVTSVMMASLYRPLYENNNEKLSKIINTITHFFRNISGIFIIYCIILAFVYPFLTESNFSTAYISSMTIILGLNMFIQYNFAISYKILLNSDNKVYITSIVQIIIVIINALTTVFICIFFPNIHIMKLITASCYLIQPIIFNAYIEKNYSLNKKAGMDTSVIAERWSGFGINVAAFIHNNTDIVILTLFTNLKLVSVYSVYLLVINGIKAIITSISSAIVPSMGRLIAKGDTEDLNSFFNIYEFFINTIVFVLFTITCIMIVPFVMIYTNGIVDVNYNQPFFAITMVFAELTYCIRDPYVSLAYHSGHFKQLTSIAFLEALINIVISIILVRKFGIIGVAFGTLISMVIRTVYQVYYLKQNIVYRKMSIFIKYIITYSLCFIVVYLISIYYLELDCIKIIDWIKSLITVSLITIACYGLAVILLFKKELRFLFRLLNRFEKSK